MSGNDIKQSFISAVKSRVEACSKRCVSASIALNLLLNELYDGISNNVMDVVIPEVWGQTFMRQLLLGTTGARSLQPFVTEIADAYPSLFHEPSDRHMGDRNIYSFAATKMSTNLVNHWVKNVGVMLKRVCYAACCDVEQAISAQHAIYGWQSGTCTSDPDEITSAWISEARYVLGLTEGECLDSRWLDNPVNLPVMLRFIVFANRKLEAMNRCSSGAHFKLCSLAPIHSVRCHFITIDTSSLHGIMSELGLVKCNDSVFAALAEEHWDSMLCISRLQGKGATFTGTIDTDGTAVCVHSRKAMQHAQGLRTSTQCLSGTERILGVDPGRSNILFVAEEVRDGVFKTYRLTRSQYYLESGIRDAAKQTARWNRSCLRQELELLSKHSPKGASLSTFQAFLAAWCRVKGALWKEYMKPRWSSMRLRLYGGKKRVFSRFLNQLEPAAGDDRETVLAYGSAKLKPSGRGEAAVPTSRAYKECASRFRTLLIPEFRTSRIDHDSGALLREVGVRGQSVSKTVRGLLWCGSTKTEGKFVNRDKNAAINIMKCARSLPGRPVALDRRVCDSRLPEKRVFKMIAR